MAAANVPKGILDRMGSQHENTGSVADGDMAVRDVGLPPYRIRRCTVDDAVPVARLLDELGYPQSVESVRRRLEPWLEDPQCRVMAVDDGEAVVGVAALRAMPYFERDGNWGRLVTLVIGSAHRRIGLGTALLNAVEAEARALRCSAMEVTSGRWRADAQCFYRRRHYDEISHDFARFFRDLSVGKEPLARLAPA